ncbi:hypothetical protein NEAUS04_1206 [Nematocida ausubeli]|nr:hypothetical protein NEAUS07_0867 [Nematocida ausubeli]KAI5147683.1 hypothetical protein NEAUS05_0972 [Nematocida ausubeli]KAI5162873.1 hypothetical protein NEAUS04_1206 [Nematocida ausubeli]
MESIRKLTEVVISTILKSEDFTGVEGKALDFLTTTLLNYMIYTGSRLKKQCEMSRRTSPTLVDAGCIIQEINAQDCQPSESTLISALEKFNSMELEQITAELESDPADDPNEFISEACTYVDCPQNYYEFLPKLPPAHTFKNSSIKRKITDDRAQKARIRNEQIKQVVENLFCIMLKTGRSPKYANYLM